MGWFSSCLKGCTSEPAVFVYCLALGLYSTIIPNYILQKVCSPNGEPPLHYNCSDASALKEATDITTLRSTIRDFIPILALLLAGSWRDVTGRNKPLMYAAIFGDLIGLSIDLLSAWRWSLSPWFTTVVTSILYGLPGGAGLFYVGATCAITDSSSPESRTARYAIYQAVGNAGACLSKALSGYCLELFGYRWFFVFVISLYLLALILVITMKPDMMKQKKEKRVGVFHKMKALFKSRLNNFVIWMMFMSSVFIHITDAAENNLILYFLKTGFNFSVQDAGLYSSFRLIFGVVSTTALSPIFSKVFKWSDIQIGTLSSAVTLASTTSMAFAKTNQQLIEFAMLDFLKLFLFTVPLSIITKCINQDEVGVFLSARFILASVLPVIIYYIYDLVFSATSETIPGAFYLISSTFILFIFICFCVSPFVYKKPEQNNSITNIEKNVIEVHL